MPAPEERRPAAEDAPEEFRLALTQIEAARMRPEVAIQEMPAPQRIAPYAAAVAADVIVNDDEVASGRLVLLHDPEGNTAWSGTFRCVAYARANIDPEMATDQMLANVGWSWLTDALAAHGAEYLAPSGTVTCVSSASFGGLAKEEIEAQVEIRASWTPVGNLTPHVEAWAATLCEAAGLAPVPDGVAVLPRNRR